MQSNPSKFHIRIPLILNITKIYKKKKIHVKECIQIDYISKAYCLDIEEWWHSSTNVAGLLNHCSDKEKEESIQVQQCLFIEHNMIWIQIQLQNTLVNKMPVRLWVYFFGMHLFLNYIGHRLVSIAKGIWESEAKNSEQRLINYFPDMWR